MQLPMMMLCLSLMIHQYDYNFGLINRTYPASKGTTGLTQWQRFKLEIDALNANAKNDTVYKILFLGRHGEGYHNAAQT